MLTKEEAMGYVIEPEKKIPVRDGVDVLVVGGGTAGPAAAIAAAMLDLTVRSGLVQAVQFLPQGFLCFLVWSAVVFGRHRDIGMAGSPLSDPDVLSDQVAD
jgi:NADPH-dependent 2,4-dienoyl-CoA reductase/sulfur reductase-like enzyme